MLLRVFIAATHVGGEEPLERLLSGSDVELTILPREADVRKSLAASVCDVLVIDRERLGKDPGAEVAALAGLPDVHDVVVLHGPKTTAEDRATLTGAGAVATLEHGVDDAPLTEALGHILARRRKLALTTVRADDALRSIDLMDFASESPAMKRLLALARKVAVTNVSVLVTGETGAGKEHLVRAIHAASPRSEGPFIAVNCAALPSGLVESELFGHTKGAFTGAHRDRRGYFELAHGGTIFLDEVGDLPLDVQVKLLRVIQEREVTPVGSERSMTIDARFMAATNRDLAEELAAKRFRSDLYYRLSVVTLEIPPLRERLEDLPRLLANHLREASTALGRAITGVEPEFLAALTKYGWPGNVRELINVIERAVILAEGPRLRLVDLPEEISRPLGLAQPGNGSASGVSSDLTWREARQRVMDEFDRRYLERILAETGGRIGEASERSGVSPRTLYDQMRRLGVRKEQFKPHR